MYIAATEVINQDAFISYGGILASIIAGGALVISAKVSKGVKPTMEALEYIKKNIEEVRTVGLATQQLAIDHLVAHSKSEHH